MSVTYAAALKTTRMNDVKAAIDAGGGPGVLEICSAAYALVLASILLASPCGSVTGAVLTLTTPEADTSADNGGTAAIARIKDSAGNIIVSGLTCGMSGTDIIMPTTTITATQVVTLTSATITHG